ncbi:hypothetical protein B7C42_08153 [Nocardia cerradoensis]|uniref:Uncharacterized protein n=1 Tax=Nocardia cerradoensis TaxID=85688 RepID=A0A231GT70_9NOCA|nr:hypothetical protein B7C42_08153 [Nocardia cerradoensis]
MDPRQPVDTGGLAAGRSGAGRCSARVGRRCGCRPRRHSPEVGRDRGGLCPIGVAHRGGPAVPGRHAATFRPGGGRIRPALPARRQGRLHDGAGESRGRLRRVGDGGPRDLAVDRRPPDLRRRRARRVRSGGRERRRRLRALAGRPAQRPHSGLLRDSRRNLAARFRGPGRPVAAVLAAQPHLPATGHDRRRTSCRRGCFGRGNSGAIVGSDRPKRSAAGPTGESRDTTRRPCGSPPLRRPRGRVGRSASSGRIAVGARTCRGHGSGSLRRGRRPAAHRRGSRRRSCGSEHLGADRLDRGVARSAPPNRGDDQEVREHRCPAAGPAGPARPSSPSVRRDERGAVPASGPDVRIRLHGTARHPGCR